MPGMPHGSHARSTNIYHISTDSVTDNDANGICQTDSSLSTLDLSSSRFW